MIDQCVCRLPLKSRVVSAVRVEQSCGLPSGCHIILLVWLLIHAVFYRQRQIVRKDEKLPRALWELTPMKDCDPEFSTMRYTACCTKNPINFTKDGYVSTGCRLFATHISICAHVLFSHIRYMRRYRLRCLEKSRRIKMLIVVTTYNEEEPEFVRTLLGINNNIKNLCNQEGKDAWKTCQVIIVSDGRTKANDNTLEYLATELGVFDEEVMNAVSRNLDVRMHMFEHTAQMVEDANHESYFYPLQLMLGLKEHNGGKLDSHLWFFNAFADHVQPKYTVLIDVGTMPQPRAILKLYKCMEGNSQIAGCCGEIATFKPNLLNPVIASQHFEYKISNIMDKSLESVFGYISVLPGAFSAYRYDAVRAHNGAGPLVEYFKSITTNMKDLGPFKGNMYLAEDRILCYELIAREGCNWTMAYVKNAVAETDVPEELPDLIKQRRRWLNGSFFALLYAILNFNRFWTKSRHSLQRKIAVSIQFTYFVVNVLLSWILLANFYLAYYYLMGDFAYDDEKGEINSLQLRVMTIIYLFLTLIQFVTGLGNRPDKIKHIYMVCMLFFGVLMMLQITMLIVYVFFKPACKANELIRQNDELQSCRLTCKGLSFDACQAKDRDCKCSVEDVMAKQANRYAVLGSFGMYFVAAALHGEAFQILVSVLQYFWMLPTYINVLTIYSFCNTHDLSWGTKGLEDAGSGHGGGGMNDFNDTEVQQGRERSASEIYASKMKKRMARKQEEEKAERQQLNEDFKAFRTYLLIAYISTNGLFIVTVTGFPNIGGVYLAYLFFVVMFLNGLRVLGAFVFIVLHSFRNLYDICCLKTTSSANFSKMTQDTYQAGGRAAGGMQMHANPAGLAGGMPRDDDKPMNL